VSEALAGDEERLPGGTTARLVLTLLALVAAVALIGGTAATITTSTVNPSGNFSAIGPEITASRAGQVPCVSGAAAVTCGDLFGKPVTAGDPQASTVTITDTGRVPVTSLQLWSAGCAQGPRPLPFAGTGDLCGATRLTVHDDSNNQCYYPTPGPGACQFAAGATLTSFVRQHGPGAPIELSSAGLRSGSAFTFAVELDPAAGNDLQGRWAQFSITWRGGA
jgi:hypothetical protein